MATEIPLTLAVRLHPTSLRLTPVGSRVCSVYGGEGSLTMVRFEGEFGDVVQRVSAELAAKMERGPVIGNSTYKSCTFSSPRERIVVGVEGGRFIEITIWPSQPPSLDDTVAVLAPYPWLVECATRSRELLPRKMTACVLLAEGWRPNAYVELEDFAGSEADARAIAAEVGNPVGSTYYESGDGERFATLGPNKLRIGLSPGRI